MSAQGTPRRAGHTPRCVTRPRGPGQQGAGPSRAAPPPKEATELLHSCLFQFSVPLELPCNLSLPVLALTCSWPMIFFVVIIILFCFQKEMRTFPLLKKFWKYSSPCVCWISPSCLCRQEMVTEPTRLCWALTFGLFLRIRLSKYSGRREALWSSLKWQHD